MYLNLFYTLYTRHFLPNHKINTFQFRFVKRVGIPFLPPYFSASFLAPCQKRLPNLSLQSQLHNNLYNTLSSLYTSLPLIFSHLSPSLFISQESIANSYQHTPSSHPLPYTVPIVSSIYSNSSYPNQPSFQTHPVWDDVISPWVHV